MAVVFSVESKSLFPGKTLHDGGRAVTPLKSVELSVTEQRHCIIDPVVSRLKIRLPFLKSSIGFFCELYLDVISEGGFQIVFLNKQCEPPPVFLIVRCVFTVSGSEKKHTQMFLLHFLKVRVFL